MNRSDFFRNAVSGVAAILLLPRMSIATATKEFRNNRVKIVKKGEGKKLNVIGDRMTVKLTGEDTGGKYALVEQYNDPGVGLPPHVHANEDEVFKLLEGEVEFWLGEKSKVLKAGDMIYCPKGIPHTWKVVGNQKAKVDLGFFPAGMEKMFDELAALPAGPPDLEKVEQICARFGVSFV